MIQPQHEPLHTTPSLDEGFVRVEGGNEQVSETGSVITAYLAMWAVMMLFTFLGWKKLASLRTQSEQLDRALKQDPGS